MTTDPIWQPQSFAIGDSRRYEMGPLSLHITRDYEEWRIGYRLGHEPLREVFSCYRTDDHELEDAQHIERIAAHDNDERREILFQPLLADRYVLARPETTMTVQSESWVALYVTTPLWLRVLRMPERSELIELPSFRPTDTWLGPPTGSGPLCYASRTTGRLTLSRLHLSPMRAITKVTLRNSGDALRVERIMVPAPQMTLHRDEEERFWTNEVILDRGRDGEFSNVSLGSRAPHEASKAQRVSAPRDISSIHLLGRAFGSLFGS